MRSRPLHPVSKLMPRLGRWTVRCARSAPVAFMLTIPVLFQTPAASAQSGLGSGVWTHVGNTSARSALSTATIPDVSQPRWTRAVDADANPITFRSQSTPIVGPALVYVLGSVRPPGSTQDQFRCFALRRSDGAVEWSAPLPPSAASLGSQSSPALDVARDVLFVPSGAFITALRARDGVQLWQSQLARAIVNASPCITDDQRDLVTSAPRNRLFITDYDFDAGGSPGALYCINIDPFHASANPHAPGAIVWSYPIGGTSGNSPAYVPRRMGGNDHVFVSSAGEPGITPGLVLALSVSDVPTPAWTITNSLLEGFFAGVSAARGTSGRLELLASSYAFFDNANTLRIDAATGTVLGDASTNRTASLPIALSASAGPGAAHVVISAGYDGFGSVPSLLSLGANTSLAPLWDSWLTSGVRMGGWNHQPAASRAGGRALCLVGTIAPGATTLPAQRLQLIDAAQQPGSTGFVLAQSTLAGGSCALAGLNAYSLGSAGLVAFGPNPLWAEHDASQGHALDGHLNTDDLYGWETGSPGTNAGDVNGDGARTAADRVTLHAWLRTHERAALLHDVRSGGGS